MACFSSTSLARPSPALFIHCTTFRVPFALPPFHVLLTDALAGETFFFIFPQLWLCCASKLLFMLVFLSAVALKFMVRVPKSTWLDFFHLQVLQLIVSKHNPELSRTFMSIQEAPHYYPLRHPTLPELNAPVLCTEFFKTSLNFFERGLSRKHG